MFENEEVKTQATPNKVAQNTDLHRLENLKKNLYSWWPIGK